MSKRNAKKQLTFILPIINFETELQEVSISPSIRIRPLTGEETEHLVQRPGPLEVTYPKLSRHCLEVKAENIGPAMKKAYPAISALRLLKPNLIGINLFLFLEGPHVYRYPGSMQVDTSSLRIKKGTFVLKKNEKTAFLYLYRKISKMIKDRKLRFALGRLNMSYSSIWLDTRLLNYMIALESLYLPGGPEKKFRLCCYMASTFSSGSEESTKNIWNYIDKAYDLRSHVVHGNGRPVLKVTIGKGKDRTEVSIGGFIDEIEEYTRQSIRKFIERGMKVKEVQSDIKEEVIKKIGTNITRAKR